MHTCVPYVPTDRNHHHRTLLDHSDWLNSKSGLSGLALSGVYKEFSVPYPSTNVLLNIGRQSSIPRPSFEICLPVRFRFVSLLLLCLLLFVVVVARDSQIHGPTTAGSSTVDVSRMRLTIAAAALVGSASADHGRSNEVEAVGESDSRHKEVLTAVLPVAAPAPELPSAAQETIASRSQRRSLEKRGVLRNLLVQSQSSSSRGECDPDVGLLACGFGQFCQSSAESSRGGLCRPIPDASFARGLQGTEAPQSGTVPPDCTDCLSGPGVYCDAASPFYGRLACECDDWTVANRTGTIDCVLTENLCNANCTESPATCYSVDFNYVTDRAGSSYQYCYNFVSPIEQTFCFGFTNDQTCFIAIDGTSCNSCNTTYQLNCEGDCFSEPCAVFDCENVGLGSGNSCLDKVIPPAYYQCWLDINDKPVNSECSLCPNSAGVLQPEKLVNLPKYGTFNCSYLERVASEGLWTTQRCSYTSLLAENICCSSISAQFQCNICGEEDHVVTKRKF